MIVAIYEATLVSREVEIPEQCPKCGISFLDQTENNLLEYRLEDNVVATSAHEDADSDDDINETCEQVFITGYRCRSCNHAIHHSFINLFNGKFGMVAKRS